jgi:dTDP-glucose 4,6-dehydratase
MSKRILLTGGAGFIGAHTFAHIMHNTDWHLVIIDSFRHKGKADRIAEMFESHPDWRQRVTIIIHDLKAPFSNQTIEQIGHIDYVINMASESHVDRSITDPRDFIENNVHLTLTMLEFMRMKAEFKPCTAVGVCEDGNPDNHKHADPVEKFIQISTDEVYGAADAGHNHKEGEPHRPSNPYSASKAAQEDICYAYWRTYELPICITNTMNIIGEMQDPEKYLPMVIKNVMAGTIQPIHASKDGSQIGSRYYLHARNQADALLFLIKSVPFPLYSSGEEIGRYNVVGEYEINNLELAQKVAAILGKELKYELMDFHSSRPGHDLRYALDGSKLAALGWKAPLSLDESLKNTVEWTIARPEWLK